MAQTLTPTAVIQVSSAPSRALYDAVTAAVAFESRPPEGLITHAAAEQADGSVLIVDVWMSGAAMDHFERERLLPAFSALPGGLATAGDRPMRHDAFHLVAGQ